MTYLEMPIPNRSEHLWRYTPWKKVHPTKVDTVPNISAASVLVNGELSKADNQTLESSTVEISKYF